MCLHVSSKNGLKQRDVLLPLLFDFALECSIRRVKVDQKSLKLIGSHQLLVYNDDLNVLGASICTVRECTEASVFVSNDIGLKLNDRRLNIWSCLETSMQCKITTYIYIYIHIHRVFHDFRA